MVYYITGPQKLVKIGQFFEKEKNAPYLCLDIGGNKESFEFLHQLLPKSKVSTLNNYKGHLKGVKNPVLFNAENQKIPFKDDSVSLVFLLDIIEHLINPDYILNEAKRVLKKDGKIIITTPNLANLYNRIFLLLGWSFSNYHASIYKTGNPVLKIRNPGSLWNENAHKSVFTFFELKELLEKKYSFKIDFLKGFSYSNPESTKSDSTYGFARKILNTIIPNQLKEGIILIASKTQK